MARLRCTECLQASARAKADQSSDALRERWSEQELVVRLHGINGVTANGLQRLPGLSLLIKVGAAGHVACRGPAEAALPARALCGKALLRPPAGAPAPRMHDATGTR